VVALLVLVTFGLAPALPAQAGGWAVTLLDPLPDEFEADRAYTIGYWVLQHGSHPFEGELGRTGLRLVGPDKVLEFDGRALPEAAHYAVAVSVPAGKWQVYAMQGWFEQFEVGTLTVPGGLVLKPSEMAANIEGHSHGGGGEDSHWGAVHPPSGVTDGHEGHTGHDDAVQSAREPAPQAAAAAQQGEVRNTAPAPGPRTGIAMALLAACGVVALFASGLATRPLRRRLGR
jgi:hypothetical protein